MGRKKKRQTKPWCWYCNREFDDEKILIQHQKAKHFKCHICNKKLFTGPGLAIHCMQVHKETIDKIPGAVPGRDNVNIEVYGMEGVPMDAQIGVIDTEPASKQPKMVPSIPIPGMPMMPPFGVMNSPFGMVPCFMPPPGVMPSMPRMASMLPPMPATSNIPVPVSTTLSGSSIPMPPQAAFPAYQQIDKGNLSGYGDSQERSKFGEDKKPIIPPILGTSKAIGARIRIVCPDENISLEEHKIRRIQQSPQFVRTLNTSHFR